MTRLVATAISLLQTLTRLAFYAGWPSVFSALPVVKSVLEKRPERGRQGAVMRKRHSMGVGLLAFALATFWGSTPSPSQDRAADPGMRDRFVGAWRLAWLEEPGPDGTIHRADCSGMFVFSADGHAAVQVLYRNPQAAAAAAPVQYSQAGYEATFGRYQVDALARTFTYHVEGAIVRSLIGKDLVRSFELSGDRLIVKSSDPGERWRVAWERYP
jgi:hypothetical protein